MATSPDYLRLATSSTRALADAALDGLREAVVVVDARHRHLPVVLVNAAARRCLASGDPVGLIESSLHRLLTAASATSVDATLASLTDSRSPTSRVLEWRTALGETSVVTDIKPLAMAPEQRLVMLTFAAAPEAGFPAAADSVGERRPIGHSQESGDRRLLALTEHARDIITVAATDGTVQFVSAGVTNSLGYSS